MRNALAQTLLKLTCPGVPDIYQGQELWDLSLVDPDNRRPVDFELRERTLTEIERRLAEESKASLARSLLDGWEDGAIKMYLTHTVLDLRRRYPELFLEGDYVPLRVGGEGSDRVVAFARVRGAERVIVVAPCRGLNPADGGVPEWGDAFVAADAELLTEELHDLFTGRRVEPAATAGEARLSLSELLGDFPVALLVGAAGVH